MKTASLRKGARVADRFVLDQRLGAGTQGVTFSAWDSITCETLVCKVSGDRDGLLQQHLKLRRIRSPRVVKSLGFFEHGDCGVLCMEWVRAPSLSNWLETPRTVAERMLVLRELCEATALLVAEGQRHRDIYAPNVLVLGDGDDPQVMLIDPQASDYGASTPSVRNEGQIDDVLAVCRMSRTLDLPLAAQLEAQLHVPDIETLPPLERAGRLRTASDFLEQTLARAFFAAEPLTTAAQIDHWASIHASVGYTKGADFGTVTYAPVHRVGRDARLPVDAMGLATDFVEAEVARGLLARMQG